WFRSRTEAGISRHRFRRSQLQDAQAILAVRHVSKQTRVGHRDLHLMRIVELTSRVVRLIEARLLRILNVDDRDAILTVGNVSIRSRDVNVVSVRERNNCAIDDAWLLWVSNVQDFQTIVIDNESIAELN